MKIYCVFFILIVPTLATEEYAEIDQLLDDPDLILELVKRLGTSDQASSKKSLPSKHSDSSSKQSYVPTVSGTGRSCKPRQYEKTIIKTEDSRKAGATFLGSAENVHTNAECLERCCSKTECDLAVYENKTKHNCYMFQCLDVVSGENKCQFASHDDYLSTTLTTFDVAPASVDSGEEASSLGESLEKATEQFKPPQPPRPTARPTQLPHSVALGEQCQLDVSCEDPHAVCFQSLCQCQQDFSQKYGVCRKVCSSDEFECKRRGTARVGPDCIPQASVCDGTTQCADGSDERGCQKAAVVDKVPSWSGKPAAKPNVDQYKPANSFPYDKQQNTGNSQQTYEGDRDSIDSGSDSKQPTSGPKPPEVDYGKTGLQPEDYEDYSDVDKELEAVTVAKTQKANISPTLRPTKPVVSWYGKDGDETDNQDKIKPSKPTSGKTRFHRVDTTVDEGSDKNSEVPPPKVVKLPKGDRPEAMPRPSEESETKQVPLPPTSSSKNSQAGASQGDAQDTPAAGSKDADGYPSFNRPYPQQTGGRQQGPVPPKSSFQPDRNQDYDGGMYGMGQQRPYPMHRPGTNSWQNGNMRKYPDNNFNHPYLGGYNYDYPDYDNYVPPAQNPYPNNHRYGNTDNGRFPANSFGGVDQPSKSNPGYKQPQNNWEDKPALPQKTDDLSDSDLSSKAEGQPDEDKTGELATDEENTPAKQQPSTDLNTQQQTDDKDSSSQEVDTDTNKSSESNESSDNKVPETNPPQKETSENEAQSSETSSKESDDDKTSSSKVTSKPKDEKSENPKQENSVLEESVFVSKEKVIVASPTDNAQGPIVALSLGLAITLMLLVFVGCRLRNVRHRLRKGRPLHSNEADYLINGMYL